MNVQNVAVDSKANHPTVFLNIALIPTFARTSALPKDLNIYQSLLSLAS